MKESSQKYVVTASKAISQITFVMVLVPTRQLFVLNLQKHMLDKRDDKVIKVVKNSVKKS